MDLLRDNKRAVVAKAALDESRSPVTVAAPTIVELLRNAYRNANKQELHRLLIFIDQVDVLPLDKQSAKRAARIDADLLQRGETIEPEDVQIAAIALENEESLLTGNKRHFERIPGLVVESY